QLLTLARPFKLRRESWPLSMLVAGVVELLEPEAAQSGVNIKLQISDDAVIEGDKAGLHQMLMNLCVNALHAMETEGQLSIESLSETAERDDKVFIGLRISDTGPGIAPEHLPHVFDPFFTTKEIGKGTGLGLSVSRRIIEEHDGWIEAANGIQRGAVFTCWLPQAVSKSQVRGQTTSNAAH
ncbi:MAG TPA: HAMP domain-containing sensor histidine kinase, partial [Blastocatellia bacterium]|nr:HAMP domain-containing sensor histidine kinase [Blastocatellia bacterium]